MLCVCLASMLVSCSDENARDQVTLYVSADEHIARQVIDRFEEETGKNCPSGDIWDFVNFVEVRNR